MIQENSSFFDDFNKIKNIPHGFNRSKGLFGDFVERNNIMNVFGHLLKKERNQTFVDRSKEFSNIKPQNSVQQSSKKSNTIDKKSYSKSDLLKNLSKDTSLDSLSSLFNKKNMDSQVVR